MTKYISFHVSFFTQSDNIHNKAPSLHICIKHETQFNPNLAHHYKTITITKYDDSVKISLCSAHITNKTRTSNNKCKNQKFECSQLIVWTSHAVFEMGHISRVLILCEP